MGVQTYHVVLIIIIIFIAIVGLCGWCVYRFFRKKRRGKDGKGGDADLAADEAALVENDEEDMKARICVTNFYDFLAASLTGAPLEIDYVLPSHYMVILGLLRFL